MEELDSSREVRVCATCYNYLVVERNFIKDLDEARIDKSMDNDGSYKDYDIDDIEEVDEVFRHSSVTDIDLEDFNDFVEVFERGKDKDKDEVKQRALHAHVSRRIIAPEGRGFHKSTSMHMQGRGTGRGLQKVKSEHRCAISPPEFVRFLKGRF